MRRSRPCTIALWLWCLTAPVAAERPAQVTFARDIAPIIRDRCTACHRPDGDAPFSLTTFDDVRRRAATIGAVTRSRYMPPWKPEPGFGEFQGARRLTDAQIALIQNWIASGAELGDANLLAADHVSPSAWPLGDPDMVVRIPPYDLRADGPDVFRNFVVTVPGDAARYVRGLQFRPGNVAVHHANIRVDRTPASRGLDESDPAPGYEGLILRTADFPDGHFLGWTPGQIRPILSDALSWRLEAKADLVVQLHMRPTGKPEVISPVIGLYWGKGPPGLSPTMVRLGRQDLDIPPGATAHRVSDSFVLPVDVQVLAVQPHAHYRARTLRAWAQLPGGSTRPLITILDWDANWQDRYQYASPFWLPAGTRIESEYVFDNSVAHARNPVRPIERAGWGWRTTDEMADVWLQVVTRSEDDRATLNRAAGRKMSTADAIGSETVLVREPRHVALRNDTALIYMALDQPAQALRHFEEVTRLDPQSAVAWFNEGVALDAMGNRPEAARRYAESIRLNPAYSPAHNNLGTLLLRDGQVAPARQEYEQAVSADPQNGEAHSNLAMVMLGQGDSDSALREVQTALERDPGVAKRLAPFILLLACHGDASARRPDAARQLGERIVAATARRDAAALDALAAAHGALGQFDAAIRISGEALSAAPAPPPAARADIRNRMALYRQGRPFTLPR